MSTRQQPRDLTPGPRRWKAVGGDRVHHCTFCGGGPTEAVVGCPDSDAPILWQVAVCRECLTDLIMTRFAAVKHQRTMALAKDMNAAADEIVKLRNNARWNELGAEELHIREKFGLLEDTPLHDVTRRGSARVCMSRASLPDISACKRTSTPFEFLDVVSKLPKRNL
jgi:hypothetical protein